MTAPHFYNLMLLLSKTELFWVSRFRRFPSRNFYQSGRKMKKLLFYVEYPGFSNNVPLFICLKATLLHSCLLSPSLFLLSCVCFPSCRFRHHFSFSLLPLQRSRNYSPSPVFFVISPISPTFRLHPPLLDDIYFCYYTTLSFLSSLVSYSSPFPIVLLSEVQLFLLWPLPFYSLYCIFLPEAPVSSLYFFQSVIVFFFSYYHFTSYLSSPFPLLSSSFLLRSFSFITYYLFLPHFSLHSFSVPIMPRFPSLFLLLSAVKYTAVWIATVTLVTAQPDEYLILA